MLALTKLYLKWDDALDKLPMRESVVLAHCMEDLLGEIRMYEMYDSLRKEPPLGGEDPLDLFVSRLETKGPDTEQ